MSDGGMQRWEYRKVRVMHQLMDSPAEKLLNDLGGEGWDLVGIDTSYPDCPRYIFKRPILVPESEPEPEPELDPEQELWLRNQSAAQALLVLPAEQQEALLSAILSEEERQCPAPPDDFHERVMRYFAEKRQGP